MRLSGGRTFQGREHSKSEALGGEVRGRGKAGTGGGAGRALVEEWWSGNEERGKPLSSPLDYLYVTWRDSRGF